MRMAWHAAGTYDKNDGTGGCNGATMRFEPEQSDPANAGLSIIRDLLHPVHKKYPEVSLADLYAVAGCVAIEFLGGPRVAFNFGRTDDADGSRCPANGRLPDAAQGAQHLRDVFYRMGFNDQEIVALSGAHTLGRCHAARSGFDGPWTSHPLRFDNQYFRNLVHLTWRKRKWDGPEQFEDEETGKLMMLPTDIALIKDDKFRPWVEKYAKDQDAWFKDFSAAYSRLLSLGCPAKCDPSRKEAKQSEQDELSAEFREHAMHGSVDAAKKCLAAGADPKQLEGTSGRSALHKAAFWGHNDMVRYLIDEVKMDVDVQDNYGDTALHDAAKFGHATVAQMLIDAGANITLRNKEGRDPLAVAVEHNKTAVIAALKAKGSKL
eukprot:TRINITY_DN63713_c0_g2_i1.p1 TRINITY_DN63713_c0_g2~~TRINITY_DN63713_c0_g2_i1.p1  ORF type:complete len:429 (+),score=248.20 TRINITY_DN63713_c0_g2_i1:159-1289(+)